jgi:hypothetical protein
LEIAPIEQTLIRQAMQARRPIPEKILNSPELNLGLQIYLQAFFDLDTERPQGMDVGRIPHSAICAYAKNYNFDADQTDALSYFVLHMDNEYHKYRKSKQPSEKVRQHKK